MKPKFAALMSVPPAGALPALASARTRAGALRAQPRNARARTAERRAIERPGRSHPCEHPGTHITGTVASVEPTA